MRLAQIGGPINPEGGRGGSRRLNHQRVAQKRVLWLVCVVGCQSRPTCLDVCVENKYVLVGLDDGTVSRRDDDDEEEKEEEDEDGDDDDDDEDDDDDDGDDDDDDGDDDDDDDDDDDEDDDDDDGQVTASWLSESMRAKQLAKQANAAAALKLKVGMGG
jgi:hypothetical protein